ncbi:hypothetical protein Y032_0021g386 [Ancylostoma ceylanicum]|uniref:Uncharacterized protein n=1 Tax=Ancylostoma ceylanicum TaxID=53326 RepID=A0A016V125_9BILA|nr:hypothetical protein Y032_0021g386 [Ancylostoma ceylanicum]
MSVITSCSQVLGSLAYLMLVFSIALWSGFIGCCRREKRDVGDSPQTKTARELVPAEATPVVKTAIEEPEINKEDKTQFTVLSINDSPKASLEVQETQPYSNIMSTQLSAVQSDFPSIKLSKTPDSPPLQSSSSKTVTTTSGNPISTDTTQMGSDDDQVDLNSFVMRAAANRLVVHPSFVKKKGNIDANTFRSKTKEELIELDEAMKSDHDSEREKLSSKESDKQKPVLKWGDTKCVVFETSSQMTFDDDEIIDEPDLYE